MDARSHVPAVGAEELELARRLFLGALAGAVMGLPFRGMPGGLRAHVFVTVGAAVFTATSQRVADLRHEDLLRIMQGIASGVGFIGAASVIRQEGKVQGVTTAASIWISAAIGCEAGLGRPWVAVVVAVVAVGLLEGLSFFERKARGR